MRTYTPRELRNAVALAVIVTATVVVALLDPSCQHLRSSQPAGPSHAIISP